MASYDLPLTILRRMCRTVSRVSTILNPAVEKDARRAHPCVSERVLSIRRIRGWVGADPYDPGLSPGATLGRSYAAL